MRFKKFKYSEIFISNPTEIDKILSDNNLHWLIDSEIENADVEIKNKTLIWNNGTYFVGHWHYGIWKNGVFKGIWENGIWENGEFDGKWKSGIRF